MAPARARGRAAPALRRRRGAGVAPTHAGSRDAADGRWRCSARRSTSTGARRRFPLRRAPGRNLAVLGTRTAEACAVLAAAGLSLRRRRTAGSASSASTTTRCRPRRRCTRRSRTRGGTTGTRWPGCWPRTSTGDRAARRLRVRLGRPTGRRRPARAADPRSRAADPRAGLVADGRPAARRPRRRRRPPRRDRRLGGAGRARRRPGPALAAAGRPGLVPAAAPGAVLRPGRRTARPRSSSRTGRTGPTRRSR